MPLKVMYVKLVEYVLLIMFASYLVFKTKITPNNSNLVGFNLNFVHWPNVGVKS